MGSDIGRVVVANGLGGNHLCGGLVVANGLGGNCLCGGLVVAKHKCQAH